MNIKCIRTTIGEDLIGDISENLDGSFTIKKPSLVMINSNGQGGFSIGLFPYLPFAEEKEFTFPKSQILFQYNAVKDLQNEYQRMHSSLILPPADTSGLKLIQ